MSERPRLGVAGTVLSTRDATALADFYSRLLDWPIQHTQPGWVVVRPDEASHGLSFHDDDAYVRPTWPSRTDQQQIMAHLDIATNDLDTAVAWAVACGAALADAQPQDDVRVMLDPDGHPFCLFESQRV
jgi:catechol 2,3-dioxygenase-like lactoylglutathione lyase family enzyme